jgi:hypothetical protein
MAPAVSKTGGISSRSAVITRLDRVAQYAAAFVFGVSG